MAKSQITKELIDKKIELSQALERVLVIAMEINDTKTIKWIKQEKNGYNEDEIVPEYRVSSMTPMGSFQVVGMGYVQNFSQQRLATKGVPDWYRETYQKYMFRQGISTIEELKNSLLKEGSEPIIPVPLEYYSFFEEGTNVNVTRAYLKFSRSDLEKIIEAVRTRTIELLVLLEKNFGVLDDLDINLGNYRVGEIKKVQEACSTVIQGDNKGDIYIINDSITKKSIIGRGNSANKEINTQVNPQVAVNTQDKKTWWTRIIEIFSKK